MERTAHDTTDGLSIERTASPKWLLIDWVMRHPELSHRQRQVCLAIAMFSDDAKHGADIRAKTLAQFSGLNATGTERVLTALIERGIVTAHKRLGRPATLRLECPADATHVVAS